MVARDGNENLNLRPSTNLNYAVVHSNADNEIMDRSSITIMSLVEEHVEQQREVEHPGAQHQSVVKKSLA